MSTTDTPTPDVLDAIEDGTPRTARKPWRCTCADPIRRYRVATTSARADGTPMGSGWSTCPKGCTREEAEALAAAKVGKPSHVDSTTEGHPPSAWHVTAVVEEDLNPNYRPDCSGDIAVGERYFEYRGECGPPWEPGIRYCAPCAIAVWGVER